MQPTFQRRKLVASADTPVNEKLPEVTDPIFRAQLIKAYRRIEEQLQKRQAQRNSEQ